MFTWEELGRAPLADGSDLTLVRSGGEYVILAAGKALMSNRQHGSEEALATLGCRDLVDADSPCVLIGGLGMGFTLRATLDVLPADARVVQAELMPVVVQWNRGPLGHLAGFPLQDPRVSMAMGDVAITLQQANETYDAILLDVDNGPRAFTQAANAGLYGDAGLADCFRALKPGGMLAVWSAWDDRKFEHRLKYGGFLGETHRVPARLRKGGPDHTIFLGRRPG